MTKRKDSPRLGWPAGKARLEGGVTSRRQSVSLSEQDEVALTRLMARWGMNKASDAIRRAIQIVAALREPEATVSVQSVCPTCDHWDFDKNTCGNLAADGVQAWIESDKAQRDPESGMVVEHQVGCPGWQ